MSHCPPCVAVRDPGILPPPTEGHHRVCRTQNRCVPEPQRGGQRHPLLPPHRASSGKSWTHRNHAVSKLEGPQHIPRCQGFSPDKYGSEGHKSRGDRGSGDTQPWALSLPASPHWLDPVLRAGSQVSIICSSVKHTANQHCAQGRSGSCQLLPASCVCL